MQTALSKREKTLIVICVIIALFSLGFWFVVSPANKAYDERLEVYEQLLTEKELMDIKLKSESGVRARLEEAKANYNSFDEKYPSILSNVEAERILTELGQESGLVLETLSMSGDLNYIRQQTKGKQNGENSPAYGIITASAAFRGGYDELLVMLEKLEDIEYIRAVRMSFNNLENNSSYISVSFEIVVLDDLGDIKE